MQNVTLLTNNIFSDKKKFTTEKWINSHLLAINQNKNKIQNMENLTQNSKILQKPVSDILQVCARWAPQEHPTLLKLCGTF